MRQTILVTLLLGMLAAGALLMADRVAPEHRRGSAPPGSRPDLVSSAALLVNPDVRFTGAIIPRTGSGGLLSGSPVGWSGWSGLFGGLAGLADEVATSWGRAGATALPRVAELVAGRSQGGFAAGGVATVVHAPPDQDYGSAVARYAIAANPDDADALYSLGLDYRDGNGVDRDAYAAARNLLAAAELGHAEAQLAIADLYRRGLGVHRNDVAAYVWYDLVAGRLSTAEKRAAAAGARDRLAALLSVEERATAKRLVAAWQPRSTAAAAAETAGAGG